VTTTGQTRREHLLSDTVAGVLATASFGSSLRHVQTVAASHGQHGLISWGIAISVELVALVAILELRRARGSERTPLAAIVALAAGLAMSAGANLDTATGAGFGWSQVVAVWPAVAYVLVAVIIETRPDKSTAHDTTGVGEMDSRAGDATDASDYDSSDGHPTAPDDSATVHSDGGERDTTRRKDGDEPSPALARLHAVPPPSTPRRATIPLAVLDAVLGGELTQSAAAEQAGVSVRTLQRHLDNERTRRANGRSAVDGRLE